MAKENFYTIASKGQLETAKFFAEKYRHIYKTASSEKPVIYRWDSELRVWKTISLQTLVSNVGKCNAKYINMHFNNGKGIDKDEYKKYIKIKAQIERMDFCKSVARYVITEFIDDDFISELDRRPDVANFRNGLYELKTGVFRDRIYEDNVSKYLDFDYEKPNKKIVNKLKKVIHQISNDDEDLYEFNLSYFGYCLTGEIKSAKFLLILGHTAENGKSTILKMMTHAFPIYAKVIDRNFFCKNNTKRHKTVAEMNAPLRLVGIEELNRTGLDVEEFKMFVDSGKTQNEVMFGTVTMKRLQTKLVLTSNHDPKFHTDEGIFRRGICEVLNNKFVAEEDYEDKPGIYLRDENLIGNIDANDKYKLALAHILLPYATKYYNEGLNVPKKLKDNFKDICDINDPIKDFLEAYYKITKDPNDRIYKEDLLSMYRKCADKPRATVGYLSSEMKKYGVQYGKDLKMEGQRGCFVGIKQIAKPKKPTADDDDIDALGH